MIQTFKGFTPFEGSKESYEFTTKGFFIRKNIIPHLLIEKSIKKIETLQTEEINLFGEEFLRNSGELGQIRALICRDPFFEIYCTTPFVDEILKTYLLDTSILHLMNGIVTTPNNLHNQAKFHRDLAKPFLTTPPLSINIFYALTEFTADTGGTWVVPGSHKLREFPSKEIIESTKVQIECEAGDAIIFDSTLVHASGINFSDSKRYALNTQFTPAFLKQQINLPMLAIENECVFADSKTIQRIGAHAIPPNNLKEFRYGINGERTYRGNQG